MFQRVTAMKVSVNSMDKNPRQITRLRMDDQYKIEYLMEYGDINTADDIIDLSNFSLKVNDIEKAAYINYLDTIFTDGQEYTVEFVKSVFDGILFLDEVYIFKGYIVKPVIYRFDEMDTVTTGVTIATLEGDSSNTFADEAAGFKFTKQANGKLLAEVCER